MNEQIIDVEVTETSLANDQIYIDKITPAVIESNIDEFKVYVQAMSKKYMNLVVSEDAIKEAKADRAMVKKAIDSIKSMRKQIKDKVEINVQSIYVILKECEGTLEASRKNIDEQIKKFEQQEKEEKRAKINGWIKLIKQTAKDSRGVTDAYLDLFQFDEKWLNKSASDKSIQEAIVNQINTIGQKFLDDMVQRNENIETIREKISSSNKKLKLLTPIKEKKYIQLLDKNFKVSEITKIIEGDAEEQKNAEENAVEQTEQVTMSKVLEEIREEDKKQAESILQVPIVEEQKEDISQLAEGVYIWQFWGSKKNFKAFSNEFSKLMKRHNIQNKMLEGYVDGKKVDLGGTK